MAQGACLCGALKYEVGGPFNMMLHCHCSMCRKHHGTGFATFVAAPHESFKWIAGEQHLVRFKSSPKAHRPFCPSCGSVGPMFAPEMGLVVVPAGNLDGELNLKPKMHVFVGSKAPWYTIHDSLPQHESWPPDFPGESIDRPVVEPKPDVTMGSCLCGDVAYEFTGGVARLWSCHCSRCRRGKSAAHGTNAFVSTDQFRWTRGEEFVASYKVPDARFFTVAFCKHCGSNVPVVQPARGIVNIPAGSLDTMPAEMPPMTHIFTVDKVAWFDIPDSLPQHEQMPPASPLPTRAT